MLLLRKVDTPQDIFVVGWSYKDLDPAFSLTDDYASCNIVSGKDGLTFETSGYVYILNREDLLGYKERLWDLEYMEDSSEEGILLENFQGEIYLDVRMASGRDGSDLIDPSEYLYRHDRKDENGENGEDDSVDEVCVIVEPTTFMKYGTLQKIYDFVEKG